MSNIICELPKNSRETIRLSLGEYKGQQVCLISAYLLTRRRRPRPTKEGVGSISHFMAAIQEGSGPGRSAMLEQKWLDKEDWRPGRIIKVMMAPPCPRRRRRCWPPQTLCGAHQEGEGLLPTDDGPFAATPEGGQGNEGY